MTLRRSRLRTVLHQLVRNRSHLRRDQARSETVSDSSQGSGAGGTPKPAPAKPAVVPKTVSAPIRPKAPAIPVRPLAPSSHDHSVPEARRAREPLPDDATVPMQRERAPSLPPEDEWTNTNVTDVTAKVLAQSPKPGAVVSDATALRQALLEALEPLQHALDDLTVKIARERVDRKEAIERLERTVARVATGNPPPVQAAPAAPQPAPAAAHKPPPVQTTPFLPATNFAPIKSPFAESTTTPMYNPEARAAALAGEAPPAPVAQPFSVSPSANPPPVAPNAPPVAVPQAAAVPQIATAAEKPASPAPVAAASVAPTPAPIVHVPAVVTPSTIPVKIDFDYSTDLSFDLPPGLDMGRRRRRMAWIVAVIVVGGAIAMLVSMLISRSQGPGAL